LENLHIGSRNNLLAGLTTSTQINVRDIGKNAVNLIYFIANNVAASANSGTPMQDYHDIKQRGSKSHTQIAGKYPIKFNLKCE
jgi:hypothetical protein